MEHKYVYEGVLTEDEIADLNLKFNFGEERLNDLSAPMKKRYKVILSALPAAAVWIV